ncbi:MAG: adenylate/guanylate cyclase domain-containing protein, partial [Candidatus Limnocylindria bacterium]
MPEERKLATVLFADIVQSSRVAQVHDPEVVRRTLGEAFAAMRDVLAAHGGTVEKFIGDAVMAVFGVPVAHEDDAERAVRAASAMREAVAALERSPALALRIGVNSGEVVAGDAGTEPLVTGSPVIAAARLQQASAPGEILVGELTRRLTAQEASFGPVREVAAKGIGSIQAAPLLDIASLSARAAAASSLFVGRRRELTALRRAFAEARRTGRPRRVLLVGPPGLGKSRLAEELVRGLDGSPVLRGRCLPYGQAVTLWPLRELVRDGAGITLPDSPEDARAKLAAAVMRAVGSEATDVLGPLAALVAAEPTASEMGPEVIATALARYLEGLAGPSGLTAIIDDLHFAEPALLEVLEYGLAHAGGGLLLLGLARPELLERYPRWSEPSPGTQVIELAPLSPPQTDRLARALLRGHRVAPERLSTLVSRSEGNPLFVEELAHVVLEQGDPAAVPPTLLALIAARLDGLEPDVKRLMQRGSVFGGEFWLDALGDDDTERTARAAADAERRRLITASRSTGPSGTRTYRFRHPLIREVAYASTSKAQRARLHDHVARWLPAAAGARAREYAEIVAYHAEQAFIAAHQIEAPEKEDLGRRAFGALVGSGTAARDRADFRAALGLYERALAVAAESAAVPAQQRARALGLAAIARLRLEPTPEALALLDEAIAAARSEAPTDDLVRMLVWRAQVALAEDVDAARTLFAEAVASARGTEDNEVIAYAIWVSAQSEETIGALRAQANVLSEARQQMTSTGADRWLVDTLVDMSANALQQGAQRAALVNSQDAVATARRRGTRLQRCKAELALARALLATGDVESALGAAIAGFELAQEIGGPWAEAESAEALAEVHVARADLGAARHVLESCAAQLDPASTPAMRGRIARVLALLARVRLAL